MNDPHEIVITHKNSNQPQVVQFSDLYALRNEIQSMMFIWNTNCYYVEVMSRIFIINGGRKIQIEKMGPCKILYRRRNQIEMGMNSSDNTGPKRKYNLILGIEEIGTKKVVFIQVSEDGRNWSWENKL